MKNQYIKTLSEVEHVLKNPGMYIGGVRTISKSLYIYNGKKMERRDVEFIPGLEKLIDEILTNAVDEAIRTDFKNANRIDIAMDKKSVRVKDNGRGLPQGKNDDGHVQAVVAYTHARTGGNFDEKGAKGGMHGLGAFLTNVFSKKFSVKTCDGKNLMTFNCTNNMSNIENPSTKPQKSIGTEIYFEPDFTLFSTDGYSKLYYELILDKVYHLSYQYPKIKFTLEWKGGEDDREVSELFWWGRI